MSSFAEMTRPEVFNVLFTEGGKIAAARAQFVLALMAYAEILADSGPCVVPSFRKDRFMSGVMDTADGALEEETLLDLGL